VIVMPSGQIWFINGVAAEGHVMDPMLTRVARNGAPTRHREWQDTVLAPPREKVEIAFVAVDPGDWMLHCHILEHQAAGMMGVFRMEPKEERI